MAKATKEKKLQIIKAAAKRFDKHGLAKTTLNEIARDLRIGKATLYGYFSSKEELFFSVLNWEGSQYLDEIKSIFEKEEVPMRERFGEYFNSKENISQRYKVLNDSLLLLLDDKGLENEITFVKNLLNEEEELIRSVLIKTKGMKESAVDPELPTFMVLKSWGLNFSLKLKSFSSPDKIPDFNKILLKLIDVYLN